MADAPVVCAVADVPTDSSLVFSMTDGDGDSVEALLVRVGERVVCWENHCQHWTVTPLDRGDGARRRGDHLVCGRHGATFDCDTGRCVAGPCEGETLDPVDVTVADGQVRLTDDDYAFESLGPAADDGGLL